jgi:hypothetical protein
MGKMITFKEYSQEFDAELLSVELTEEEQSELNEVLDTTARLKRRNILMRNRARLKIARKVQSRRLADTKRLHNRANQRARNLLIKRLYQGRSRSQIPLSQRASVSARLQKMSGAIKRISNKLLRRVRQQDIARKTHRKLPKFNITSAL